MIAAQIDSRLVVSTIAAKIAVGNLNAAVDALQDHPLKVSFAALAHIFANLKPEKRPRAFRRWWACMRILRPFRMTPQQATAEVETSGLAEEMPSPAAQEDSPPVGLANAYLYEGELAANWEPIAGAEY